MGQQRAGTSPLRASAGGGWGLRNLGQALGEVRELRRGALEAAGGRGSQPAAPDCLNARAQALAGPRGPLLALNPLAVPAGSPARGTIFPLGSAQAIVLPARSRSGTPLGGALRSRRVDLSQNRHALRFSFLLWRSALLCCILETSWRCGVCSWLVLGNYPSNLLTLTSSCEACLQTLPRRCKADWASDGNTHVRLRLRRARGSRLLGERGRKVEFKATALLVRPRHRVGAHG